MGKSAADHFSGLPHFIRVDQMLSLLATTSGPNNSACGSLINFSNGSDDTCFHSTIFACVAPVFLNIISSLDGSSDVIDKIIAPHIPSNIILKLKDLAYKGACSSDSMSEIYSIKNCLKDLGNKWNIRVTDESEYNVHVVQYTVATTSSDNSMLDESNYGAINCHMFDQRSSDEEDNDELSSIPFEEIIPTSRAKCFSDFESRINSIDDEELVLSQKGNTEDAINIDSDQVISDFSDFNDDTDEGNIKCSRFCSNKCADIVKMWPQKTLSDIRCMFKSETGFIGIRNKLLSHLIGQSNVGVNTDFYKINGHAFCLKVLSAITEISIHVLKKVLLDFWKGQKMYQHGNVRSLKSPTPAVMSFICWMKQFALSYGQYAPDTNTVVLSYWLNKKYLHSLLKQETVGPHISLSAFYENFTKYFSSKRVDKTLPHIRISKYSSHSICNQCVAINNARQQARTESELQRVIEASNHHKHIFGEARRVIQEIKQSAISFPSDNLFIQVKKARMT